MDALEGGFKTHFLSDESISLLGCSVPTSAMISSITLPNYTYHVLDRVRIIGMRNVAMLITKDLLQSYISYVFACVEAQVQCPRMLNLLNAYNDFRVIARPTRDDREDFNSACRNVLAPFALLVDQTGVSLAPLMTVPDLRILGDSSQFAVFTADNWIAFFYGSSLQNMYDFMLRRLQLSPANAPILPLLIDPLKWWAGRSIFASGLASLQTVYRLDRWFDLYRFDVSDVFFEKRDLKQFRLSQAFSDITVNLIDRNRIDTQCVIAKDISKNPTFSVFLDY